MNDLLPYQHALYDKLQAGGFKQGELVVFAASRQTGKSMLYKTMLNEMYGSMTKQPIFSVNGKAEVDGATWYTVHCNRDISTWLRNQPKEWHYEALAHGWSGCQFDIHEKLYTMLILRWS